MKRTLEFLLVGLLAGGLLTGCPNKEQEQSATPEEPATAAQEEPKEEEPKEEPKAEINQENYLQAAFEVSCVMAKVEDVEKQKEITTEIYPRYGFTAESFAEAQTAMKDNTTVQTALEEKMKTCTPELALGLATAGADADAGAEEAKEETKTAEKPAAPAKKWKSGSYTAASVTGGGFEGAQLKLNITDAGKVMGQFKGKREGKAFMIPLKGDITKDGTVNASGNKGPNNARVTAKYGKNQVAGTVKGAVNKKGFDVGFAAK